MNQSNIYLPAEWEKQDGILLSWPHSSSDWQPILDEVEPSFAAIARYICESQALIIICHDQEHQMDITQKLLAAQTNIDAIKWLHHPCNDTWCRDYGPISISHNGTFKALNFQFNGWGNKYDSDLDNAVNEHLKAEQFIKSELESINLVLEGGSIESDGLGTLLTTSNCLLADSRNPTLNRQEIENKLKQTLGFERILWLESGYLSGDDTDSHIDNLARFCNEDTIAYCACSNPDDIHYDALQAMKTELEQFRTRSGKPYNLIPLEMPAPVFDDEQRLPASYANFLITNDYILLPFYDESKDEIVRQQLQDVFKTRKVVGIPCRSVIKQYGSIHCLTMQLPAGVMAN